MDLEENTDSTFPSSSITTNLERDLRKFEARKYGIIDYEETSMIKLRELDKLNEGITFLPHIRCTACGSFSASIKYDQYYKMIENGISSKDAFDRLGMKYCCRMNVANPIIMQYSMMDKEIVERKDLNMQDVIRMSANISKIGTGQRKKIEKEIKIFDIPMMSESGLPVLPEDLRPQDKDQSEGESESGGESGEENEGSIFSKEIIEKRRAKKQAFEILPDWEYLDTLKRVTILENYFSNFLKNKQDEVFRKIYPNWDFLSNAERDKIIQERKQKIEELNQIVDFDILSDETKKEIYTEKLLSLISEDEIENFDFEDISTMKFEIRKRSPSFFSKSFIQQSEKSEQTERCNCKWQPEYWENYSTDEKYKYLENKIFEYIDQKLVPFNRENWKQYLIELRRKQIYQQKIQNQMNKDLQDVFKIRKNISQATETSEERITQQIITESIESERQYRENKSKMPTTKRSDDDEFVDVGCGYKVRVLKRVING